MAYEGQQKGISAHVKGKGPKKGESLRMHFFADYRLRKIVIAHFSFADFALLRSFLAGGCCI